MSKVGNEGQPVDVASIDPNLCNAVIKDRVVSGAADMKHAGVAMVKDVGAQASQIGKAGLKKMSSLFGGGKKK